MVKRIIAVAICIIVGFTITAQSSFSDSSKNKHEVYLIGINKNGINTIRIWQRGNTVSEAIELAKKNVVITCLFKGFPSTGFSESIAPMCKKESQELNIDFFNSFFADSNEENNKNNYLNFINVKSNMLQITQSATKIRNEYKIYIDIDVFYSELKKFLEDKNIIINN